MSLQSRTSMEMRPESLKSSILDCGSSATKKVSYFYSGLPITHYHKNTPVAVQKVSSDHHSFWNKQTWLFFLYLSSFFALFEQIPRGGFRGRGVEDLDTFPPSPLYYFKISIFGDGPNPKNFWRRRWRQNILILRGERAIFLVKIFQKVPKNAVFGLFFQNFDGGAVYWACHTSRYGREYIESERIDKRYLGAKHKLTSELLLIISSQHEAVPRSTDQIKYKLINQFICINDVEYIYPYRMTSPLAETF